jgi:hypothetical protein
MRFRVKGGAASYTNVSLNLSETNLYALRMEIKINNEITISSYGVDGSYNTASTAFPYTVYTSTTDNITIGDASNGFNGVDGVADDFTVITSLLPEEDFYRYYMGLGVTDL